MLDVVGVENEPEHEEGAEQGPDRGERAAEERAAAERHQTRADREQDGDARAERDRQMAEGDQQDADRDDLAAADGGGPDVEARRADAQEIEDRGEGDRGEEEQTVARGQQMVDDDAETEEGQRLLKGRALEAIPDRRGDHERELQGDEREAEPALHRRDRRFGLGRGRAGLCELSCCHVAVRSFRAFYLYSMILRCRPSRRLQT